MSNDPKVEFDPLCAALQEVAAPPPMDFVPGTALPPQVAPADAVPTLRDDEPSFDPEARLDTADALRQQAAFLEREARNQPSAAGHARALVIASELWAHLGETQRARACARAAAAAAPSLPLTHMQLRALNPRTSEEQETHQLWVDSLQLEARLGTDPAGRAHAALLLADLMRAQGDQESAEAAEELARRYAPGDLRPLVSQIAQRLAQNASPLSVPLPPDSPLRSAALRLAELHGERDAPEPTAALLLERARRQLANRQWAAAAQSLLQAAELSTCPGPLLEVAASLAAHHHSERPLAIRALRLCLQRGASRNVVRTLAARALEQGDRAALSDALEAADPASGTFSASERVVLSLLGGGALELNEIDLEALAQQGHPALATALAPQSGHRLGSSPAALESAVGSQLATSERDELSALLERLSDTSPLRHLFASERALASGDAETLAATLERLASCGLSEEVLEFVGLIREGLSQPEQATAAYERAFESAPSLRLMRALDDGDQDRSTAALHRLLDATSDGEREALLRIEATWRKEPRDGLALLEGAKDRGSAGLLVSYWGAYLAGRAQDAARRAFWLRRIQELSSNTTERAVALLRESSSGAAGAEVPALIAELAQQRPDDLALRRYGETLIDDSASQLAELRLAARPATDAEAAWLAADATIRAWSSGDVTTATKAARKLLQAQTTPFNEAFASMLAGDGGEATELSRGLLEALQKTTSIDERRELFERLAALDEARGDMDGCTEWHRALLAESPGHLRSLRHLERELLYLGEVERLEPVAAALATHLHPEDGTPYRLWLAANRLLDGDLRAARRSVEPLTHGAAAPTFALRTVETHARQIDDYETLRSVNEALLTHAGHPDEACALLLQASFVAARLDRHAEALALIDRSLQTRPDDLVGLWLRSELLERAALPALAAPALERLADRMQIADHRLSAWLRAGRLWLSLDPRGSHSHQAEAAFSKVLELDPAHVEAYQQLCALATKRDDNQTLARLLEARREHASPEERLKLWQDLARCHHHLGDTTQERRALEEWLQLAPTEGDAWRAHAHACTTLGDYQTAKDSWLRFLEAHPDKISRNRAHYALALLYDEHLGNPQDAAHAYEEVLAERPHDADVMSRLVRCYRRLRAADRAIALQTKLIQLATSLEEKRDGALALASLYEDLAGDTKRAAATLERACKAWPMDPIPLAALARFMDRQGERGASRILVDRVGKEVRRKLEAERIEPGPLDMLATVAELQGNLELARCTQGARQAWLGESDELPGAGPAALDEQLDDLLAPQEMSTPLRVLLQKTGLAFDAAFSVDARALSAQPLPSGPVWTELQELSQQARLGEVQVFVTPSIGARCLPAQGSPAPGQPHQVLVGTKLEQLDPQERKFLMLRALKLQQSGAGALARSRGEDAWSMLAALLHLFAPNWMPAGVDPSKLALARGRLERGLQLVGYDDDVPFLVLEAIGTLSQQASALGESIRLLPNRAALLGVGSLAAAFDAFGHCSDRPLADSGPSRWRWLNGHGEARDLALFCTSKAYADARVRVGLAPEASVGSATSLAPSLPPRPPQRSFVGSMPPPPPRRKSRP